MNTYKIIGLKVPWNQHLQKGGVGAFGCGLYLQPAQTMVTQLRGGNNRPPEKKNSGPPPWREDPS
jgi:hypothetical protein